MLRHDNSEDEEDGYREYVGLEPGLMVANRNYISIEQEVLESNKKTVELIVSLLTTYMRLESPTFNYLYKETFGGGSGYEGLKITKPDEFDIDILMRIPAITKPSLFENNIPGYVNLKVETLERLKRKNLEVYNDLESFVDEKNYLLTHKMKSFIEKVFNKAMRKYLPHNLIFVGDSKFRITRQDPAKQKLGPALTLTIQGPNKFRVMVDLVPCIWLGKSQWPGEGFESNPFSDPDVSVLVLFLIFSQDFFLVPKSPKRNLPHIERYWRLSFQKQEREMIFDKQNLKPTIKILKRVRDRFKHKISSYAIKTMFLKELKSDDPTFGEIPELWLAPLSYCVVYMLEVYAEYLGKGKLPYFWNKKMNLLEGLTPDTLAQYQTDIECMLADLKSYPDAETVLRYLS